MINAPVRRYTYVLAGWLAVGLLVAFQLPDDAFLQRLIRQLTRFYAATYPEESYLHLDKPTYVAGETVWFKAYVVDAARHRPDTLSRVLYVDLLGPNQKLVRQEVLQLTRGTTDGSLPLTDTLAPGRYTVRAYTNWMRNIGPDYFYTRAISILQTPEGAAEAISANQSRRRKQDPTPVAAKLAVQFFPEGGDLITGLESSVGFKAIDGNGRGVEVQGVVKNKQGQDVVTFQSQHLGMGRFQLKPEVGQTYQAVVRQPNGTTATYPLPAAKPNGFTLRVVELADRMQVFVQRQAAPGQPASEPITLLVHVRGQVAYAAQGQVTAGAAFGARIPKDRFPAGVAHFTLFDGQQVARCERLAFVGAADPGLRITLQPNKTQYAPREKVTVQVAVADAQGQPVAGQFSMAVNNAQSVPADPNGATIRTHLLLTADVRGTVEDPGYYFNNPSYDTKLALDNLLLTQGWRRFAWNNLLADRLGRFPFPLEQSLSLSGQVLGNKDAPASGATVTLLRFQPKQTIDEATTDSAGRFLFSGFAGQDSTRMLLRVKSEKGLRNPTLLLDSKVAKVGTPLPVLPTPDATVAATYVQNSKKQQVVERQYSPDAKRIVLENVTVRGRRSAEPDARRLYGTPDASLRLRDIPAANSYYSVLQVLQGRLAGVQVTGSPPNMRVSIRGGGTPLFILDGIPVDMDAINSIPTTDIETVEVLKGPSAAIYGVRGGNGVISVLTKRGNSDYDYSNDPTPPGMLTYAMSHYYQPREFYVPAYNRPATVPPADYRSATLYWGPRIVTDAGGRATVTFYCSDVAGSFRLSLEGIANTGIPGIATGTLTVTPK